MKTFILSIVFSVYASMAFANREIIMTYIDWLVANSEFEYNGEELPLIGKMSFDEIQKLAYGEEAVERAANGEYELDVIIALYNHNIDTIIVNEDFDIENFEHHHILVHELVHYLQDINGITDACVQNLEPIAYELQDKWQKEVDHPGPEVNFLFVAMLRGYCSNPH